MKKKLCGIICVLSLISMSSCSNEDDSSVKDYILNKDTFLEVSEEYGLVVSDVDPVAEDTSKGISEITLAVNTEKGYQLEFYELIDEESAVELYNTSFSDFEALYADSAGLNRGAKVTHGDNWQQCTVNLGDMIIEVKQAESRVLCLYITSVEGKEEGLEAFDKAIK